MSSKWLFLLGFTIPISTLISLYFVQTMSWFGLFVAFFLVPILDIAFTSKSDITFDNKSFFFDFFLYLQVPIQFALLFYFLNIVTQPSLSLIEVIFITISMGINCGVGGINTAHELGHRSKLFEVLMAKALLCSSLYYQFYIDHNKGHHKYVCTPHDPSSARLNESVYKFIFRSLIGTFKSAFKIDSREMLIGLVLEGFLLLGIYFLFDLERVLFFMTSAFIGGILLECVNYIEHYGLVRKQNSSGRFEKVMPYHSWNSNHSIGRGVLFNLSRHSDHHYMVSKHYQQLQSHSSAPNLPTGYPGMIILSLVPCLWFKVMNKRLFSCLPE